MRDKEHPPLLSSGFKNITEEDLHYEFVQQLKSGHDHRNNLLIGFGSFLNEFKKLNLKAEIWIDGSFATEAPDPSDVDVVFFLDPSQIEDLSNEKRSLFEKLFLSKKFMRNLYKVEVYVSILNMQKDQESWLKVFGTWYDNVTPKGIFRLKYAI